MSPTHNTDPYPFFYFPADVSHFFSLVVFVFDFEFLVTPCNSVGLSQCAQMRDERERGEAVTVFGVSPPIYHVFYPSFCCVLFRVVLFVLLCVARQIMALFLSPLPFLFLCIALLFFVPKKGFVFFCSFFLAFPSLCLRMYRKGRMNKRKQT